MMHVVTSGRLQSGKIEGLQGDIIVPGDKSISHRALVLASQALGMTRISGLLEGEDVLATARALRHLGVRVERLLDEQWQVQGVGVGGLQEPTQVLDMGNAGTGTRLMMGLLTPYPFTSFFTGDESLASRPMARVAKPLQLMGAQVTARSGIRLPLALIGTASPMPISYTLPVASAQVKSAVLLAALNTPGVTTVTEPHPTRDHTENMLEHFGFKIERKRLENGGVEVSLQGQQEPPYSDREFMVPSDPSSAAFPAVAAVITPKSDIVLENVSINPLRAGLFETLKEMGADVTYQNERVLAGEPVADIRVRSGRLKAIEVPAERAPSMIDEYPILAVAAAFAEGTTVMHGLGELRVKESDRLQAVIDGLTACGVKASAEGDSLKVEGSAQVQGGGLIRTHMDHRIAMAFLVMGMAAQEPVVVDDGSMITTSFPGFAALMNRHGAKLGAPVSAAKAPAGLPGLVVAIDGPAASGKGTLARRLADFLDAPYLDTGSLYRAVGMKLAYSDRDPHNVEDAVAAAKEIDIEDLANPRLRQEHIGQAASIASAMPQVREVLLEFQRNFTKNPKGAVLDGRDIGTVVCPDASVKVFLTASLEARAKRRHRELSGQGIEVVYDSVLEDLRERDQRDSRRSIAPLKPANDAIVLDTSQMDAVEVFETVVKFILDRYAKGKQPSAANA